MEKPTLVVMAAGMGSRYGGLKQIDPVSDSGEIIVDFSLYDAMLAGFDRAVFVIRREHEEAFRDLFRDKADRHMEIEYAFQDIDDLPKGYSVPEGRTKPWGTCHAVRSARDLISGPFAVINADDYYGPSAFQSIYEYLSNVRDDSIPDYAMVGFQLKKTLTENGTVSRGVCDVDDKGYLNQVVERTKVRADGDDIVYTEDEGESWNQLPRESTVSMNFWGFTSALYDEIEEQFPAYLDRILEENPMKGEFFLPSVVQGQIDAGQTRVRVLESADKWYGITYKADKEMVYNAIQSMKDKGLYPDRLW